ncbi:MAG: hypothetical protein KBT46_03665 [Ruminococcus sp.]|nr:hypothetical protein [Candidatus Copronaster equi]
MPDDFNDSLKNYAVLGVVMAAFMLIIRPFVSMRQTIRETAIVFVFTVLAGVILENFEVSKYLKLGLSGVIGFWAVEIYRIGVALFQHVEENPENILGKLHK